MKCNVKHHLYLCYCRYANIILCISIAANVVSLMGILVYFVLMQLI